MKVEDHFARLGFAISDAGPIAFSITGSQELFLDVLGAASTNQAGAQCYSTDALPSAIRDRVEAIEMEEYENFSSSD